MKVFSNITISILTAVFSIGLVSARKNAPKDSLNLRQQSIIAIAAITAKGDLTKLPAALNKGLDAGLSINEIKESLIHLYAYCGFPRSLRGLQTFMVVLDERKAKGIDDVSGAESSPLSDNRSKYDRGKTILEKLTGQAETGPKSGYAAFAPTIEIFLKEHLFADIFERDVLGYTERELITIAVLSSIGGVEPMLKSHLNICMNIGLSPAQLQQFIGIVNASIGAKEANEAQLVLNELLKSRK